MNFLINILSVAVIIALAWLFWRHLQDGHQPSQPTRGRQLKSADDARAIAQRRVEGQLPDDEVPE